MKFRSHGNSHTGRMRRRNEDAFLNDATHHLYAVADGLGGLAGGDKASRLAVTLLKAHQKEASQNERALDLPQAFADAHSAITKLGAQIDPVRGSGTTLTVARITDETVSIGHAGDSAAYLFRSDQWRKLTTDHTEAEILRRTVPGTEIPLLAEHTLTRCLGQPSPLEVDWLTHTAAPGDRLFLCTDGITRHVDPHEIHQWLKQHSSPKSIVDEVIKIANRRGGSDNLTAVAIFID